MEHDVALFVSESPMANLLLHSMEWMQRIQQHTEPKALTLKAAVETEDDDHKEDIATSRKGTLSTIDELTETGKEAVAVAVDDDGDIYPVSSGEDFDIVDATKSSQNYVAYIMEQTEGIHIL